MNRAPSDVQLQAWVSEALSGKPEATESLLRAIQDDIYGLALKMLWHPQDAADATQEILIQVVTHLATFRGESSFRTWCFRIATRALLRNRQKRQIPMGEPLESEEAQSVPGALTPEQKLLEREVRMACSLALLQRLDLEHRLAYVLGEVLGMTSAEGAEISGVESATYRKRLSRARERMSEFLLGHCGVVNEKAACRCRRRVQPAIEKGWLEPDALLYANLPERVSPSLLERAHNLTEVEPTTRLYTENQQPAAPQAIGEALRRLLTLQPGA